MDGLEFTQRIRRSPRAEVATLPVIALTALAMPGDRERCYDAGTSSYMSKPFRLQELAGIIKEIAGTEVKSGARLS